MEKKKLIEKIEIPEGITVNLENNQLVITGEKGSVAIDFRNPKVKVKLENNQIELVAASTIKKNKAAINSQITHIKNAFLGVTEGFVYKLKVCSGHFPMSVAVSDGIFTIKNFLGEKVPRKVKLKENVSVKVEGSEITVESVSKEFAGQTAANIEQLTRRPGFDKRIFQDGIYITDKAGKLI